MTDQEDSPEHEFREEQASLWKITFGPLVWAVHFLASYAGTAVFCEKWPEPATHMGILRWAVLIGTVVALAAIAWLGWSAWRQWSVSNEDTFEDADGSNEDRHQFLGHAALLLAVISFVGVIYTALPAIFSATCR